MDWRSLLEARPIVVALAGSNGAGKSTFFHAHLADTGLRFVNAGGLVIEMGMGAYEAAELAASLRASLVGQRESFVFQTVLSDPVGAKVSELVETSRNGIHVVMIFIRVDSPETSKQRVAMRVMQGEERPGRPERVSRNAPHPLRWRFSRVNAGRVPVRSFPTYVGRIRHCSEALDVDHGQLVYPSLERRRDRLESARARPSRWAGHGRERRAVVPAACLDA